MKRRVPLSGWFAVAALAGASLPALAQVLIVRADGGERSIAIAGGFVQGAITADVPGLDYDQLVWGGTDASHAAAIEAVKTKRARAVFTDSPEAARELVQAVPDLKVVLAGSERAADNRLDPSGRMSVVLPMPSPDAFIRVVQKNFKLRRLVLPYLQDRSPGLPAAFLGDKRLAITPIAVPGLDALASLDDALAQADGVLLVPGALPAGKGTTEALGAIATARRVPMIALTPDWVAGGATAAIYADPGDLGSAGSQQILALLAGSGQLSYVSQVSIAVRRAAAQRAGFDLKGLTVTRSYE